MLEVSGLSGGYGDIRVLWDVDLRVRPGRVTAVLGRNGAGKTSLLNAIAGFAPAVTAGTVTFAGRDVTGLAPHRRVHAGLGYVQEGKQVFRRRTVEDNLLLGSFTLATGGLSRWTGGRKRSAARREALDRQYERFPMLAERRHTVAGSLSGGQQQMLAIAQALMPGPRLLMLDEPSAGLAPVIAAEVFEMITALRADGLSLLLVEQVVEYAMRVADDVAVVDNGRIAAAGDARSFDDTAVINEIYLGVGAGDGRHGS
ncbi:ABC transporter ATP-binding protein [Actinomadura sp. 1N219]|uniref:ABC transporter ATP-binding protein n=1 Tax=Actinomadura sp. 1N219 TaxID=3375152 RepID=UPI0037AB634D